MLYIIYFCVTFERDFIGGPKDVCNSIRLMAFAWAKCSL